jgi:predicted small integral membrane protein
MTELVPLSWMAWTPETAIFFATIAALLVAMTIWELRVPGGDARRGILAVETTRGDRLFVSLLGGAYIHLAWLAFFGVPLWGAAFVTILFAAAVFRWV